MVKRIVVPKKETKGDLIDLIQILFDNGVISLGEYNRLINSLDSDQ